MDDGSDTAPVAALTRTSSVIWGSALWHGERHMTSGMPMNVRHHKMQSGKAHACAAQGQPAVMGGMYRAAALSTEDAGVSSMQGPNLRSHWHWVLFTPESLECSIEAAVHGRTVLQILQQHIVLAASPTAPLLSRGKRA